MSLTHDNLEEESRKMAAELTGKREKLRERFYEETGFVAMEDSDAPFEYEYTLWLEDKLVNNE